MISTPEQVERELEDLDDNQLLDELRKSLDSASKSILRAAVITALLVSRGVEVPLQAKTKDRLLAVAEGRCHPDLFARCHWNGAVFNRLASLPLAEQKRLLVEPVEVLHSDGQSSLVPVDELTSTQARVCLTPNGVRSLSAQAAIVRRTPQPKASRRRPDIMVDRRRRGILVTGVSVFISHKELASLLTEVLGKEEAAHA